MSADKPTSSDSSSWKKPTPNLDVEALDLTEEKPAGETAIQGLATRGFNREAVQEYKTELEENFKRRGLSPWASHYWAGNQIVNEWNENFSSEVPGFLREIIYGGD